MFEPYEKSDYNFIANKKLTSCYNVNILNRKWEKIYVTSIELCMKGDLPQREISPVKHILF